VAVAVGVLVIVGVNVLVNVRSPSNLIPVGVR
jgi:hypothetical protein